MSCPDSKQREKYGKERHGCPTTDELKLNELDGPSFRQPDQSETARAFEIECGEPCAFARSAGKVWAGHSLMSIQLPFNYDFTSPKMILHSHDSFVHAGTMSVWQAGCQHKRDGEAVEQVWTRRSRL
ncbi:hypothetical protein AAF712_006964 [Marasmius tenuissimus]|uniref:Uncharacterized protein n=1 Tax=Marasmius tenuissimus TaxID=585030 RepID=A0ABR2ZXF5_9AGAR